MPVDAKSLARVRRLLDGGLRLDDLTNLFLYARDRCNGRESVQEIGDFVAHHNASSLFSTNIKLEDACTDTLLKLATWDNVEIELNPDGKLDLMDDIRTVHADDFDLERARAVYVAGDKG